MTTTDDGVATTDQNDTLDSAADAFLSRLTDADKLSQETLEVKKKPAEKAEEKPETKEEEPKPDDAAEEQDADGEDKPSEETEDDKPKDKTYVEDDEAVFKVKVGDEEHEVSAKDLKRLYGQEKALTQKSQEVAEKRKSVDLEASRNLAALNVLLERAKAKAEPYKKIDFLVASKQLNTEELTALRDQAQQAFDEEKFLSTELNGFAKTVSDQQQATLIKTAQETVKTLNNPESPYHIEGWNEKYYNDLRTFAVEEGIPSEIVNQLVEAPILKLLQMAMSFKKGSTKVVETKKVNNTPKKIVKTTNSPVTLSSAKQTNAVKKADAALKAKGSMDNATNAFLARMKSDDD